MRGALVDIRALVVGPGVSRVVYVKLLPCDEYLKFCFHLKRKLQVGSGPLAQLYFEMVAAFFVAWWLFELLQYSDAWTIGEVRRSGGNYVSDLVVYKSEYI